MNATDILARYMPIPVRDMASGDILAGELVYGPGLEPHQVTVLLPGQRPMLVPHADLAACLTRTVRVELAGGLRLTMFPQATGESVVWELSSPAAADVEKRVTLLLVRVGVGWLLPYLAAAADAAPAGVDLPVVDWDSAAAEWFGENP
ncbi:hypothetical protein [Nonomuraea wenchangensis]|uniref:Uncharacterized protein n=1 Tax=Nonomuraea wenchangensis TaxID=568860 RepID=A0A1I0LVD4_9ACTN|nr:hypothetical protein [Nonomuraea wenchangensis]SEU46692.1 hypothetical protein SAMN05421811_127121 [Nonomuraea wenchangensis]